MKVSRFYQYFPPPAYMAMPVLGLDISDQSAKCVELIIKNGETSLGKYHEVVIPAGIIEAGKIKDKTTLEGVLKKLRSEFTTPYVAASLPEEQAYIINLVLPYMRRSELAGAIELQLEEHVPLAPTNTIFDFDIFKKPKNSSDTYEVGVSVLPRGMVEEYTDAIKAAGFIPVNLEIEAQAIARAVVKHKDPGTVLVVDIGKVRTGFSVVASGVVVSASTITNIGGEDITKHIQKTLNVSYEEAEALKREKGLLRSDENKELFLALVPVLSTLKDEIGKLFSYWNTRDDSRREFIGRIEAVVLCGGQATLPGLVEYIAANLNVPVHLGNPWTNILDLGRVIPPLERNVALRYTTAFGLALNKLARSLK